MGFGTSLNIKAPEFHKKVSELNNQHHTDSNDFYKDFMKLFSTINDLSNPLKWMPSAEGMTP